MKSSGWPMSECPPGHPFVCKSVSTVTNWLARRLDEAGIEYEMAENAFLLIEDFEAAQRLADRFRAQSLHRRLNQWAKQVLPWLERFSSGYHWCFRQVEYATDVVFRRQADLQPLYKRHRSDRRAQPPGGPGGDLPGSKAHPRLSGEAGNDFSTRIRGETPPASAIRWVPPASSSTTSSAS